ncbi:hypothetical protein [Burkholderia sp. BCC1644]|uniref:hypothetical protein n=1 Tax=Burkholderia sp. BCC1644 TaxID=2676293 RepID=UPI001591F4A9|nr:hypothetical protein [Burkholderia sp. BCC1644]
MRVLPNRNVRTRDAWRTVSNARAESRHAERCRCRECGFVAPHALERCPACGQWDWPFDPLRHTPDPAHAAHAPHAVRSWSSRVAHSLRNATFRRPSASSAPILSLLTLVLLVGGYVMVDRTCKADPVCRGSGAPAATATESGLHTVNEPMLPVLPTPAFPFHPPDRTPQLAAIPPHADANASLTAGKMQVAQAAPSMRAPDRPHASAVRMADWKGSRDAAHRTHPIRRVSLHTRHGRYTASSNAEVAKLYRGH